MICRAQSKPNTKDRARINTLDVEIESSTEELEELQTKTVAIESAINGPPVGRISDPKSLRYDERFSWFRRAFVARIRLAVLFGVELITIVTNGSENFRESCSKAPRVFWKCVKLPGIKQ